MPEPVITYREFITVFEQMRGFENARTTFIEALDIVCEKDVTFPRAAFVRAFANALHHNGIIRAPDVAEICLLDSQVISKFGRNYRMADIVDSIATMYMARETFPRTSVEVRKSHNVVPFRSVS